MERESIAFLYFPGCNTFSQHACSKDNESLGLKHNNNNNAIATMASSSSSLLHGANSLRFTWICMTFAAVFLYHRGLMEFHCHAQHGNELEEQLSSVSSIRNSDDTTPGNTSIPTVTSSTDSSAVICTVLKNALPYIDEWYDYNMALGFQAIYIYDNSDHFELKDWVTSHKQVYVKHAPGTSTQKPSNEDCLRWAKAQGADWIAFIDIDEFIVVKNVEKYAQNNNKTISSSSSSIIVQFLHEVVPKDKPGLSLTWLLFDFTAESIVYQPLPVTKRFLYRREEPDTMVKTIVRANSLKTFNIHSHYFRQNKRAIDTLGNPISPTGVTLHRSIEFAVLHHYKTKSLEEYQYKCQRGDVHYDMSDLNKTSAATTNKRVFEVCWPKERLISKYRNSSTIFDSSAWDFLVSQNPVYRRYETYKE